MKIAINRFYILLNSMQIFHVAVNLSLCIFAIFFFIFDRFHMNFEHVLLQSPSTEIECSNDNFYI